MNPNIAKLLTLPFYKRFDAPAVVPWKIIDTLNTLRVVFPILVKTLVKYPFVGPKKAEWTFLYNLVVSVLGGYLSAFRTRIPDVVGSQRKNSRASSVPTSTIIREECFDRSRDVVEYFKTIPNENSEPSHELGSIYGEWLYPSGCSKSNILFYLHGGAYVTGSCQLGRALIHRIAKSSNSTVFSINYRLAPQKYK